MNAAAAKAAARSAGRPEALFPLFAELATLPGIGPRLAKLLAKLGLERVVDLLFYRPNRIIDRRYRPRIAEAEIGRIATLRVIVDGHQPPPNRRQPYKVRVRDETGFMTLAFFHADGSYMNRMLPVGETRWVSGTIDEFHGERQMAHPDFIVTEEDFATLPDYEPVYPLTAGLSNKVIRRAAQAALERVGDLPEWQDAAYRVQRGWPDFKAAVTALHSPASAADIDLNAPALQRLAYDELLSSQLALSLIRARMHGARGRSLAGTGEIRTRIIRSLPFSLTEAQKKAIGEIEADLAAPKRMVRLLQGDVGAGKTLVALMAMATAVEAGAQAALMAPTEILARQHEKTIRTFAEAAGLRVVTLTGRDKGAARDAALAEIKSGEADIVLGTHAVIEHDVHFKDLALVVVDEQHRFGVHQRLALAQKGQGPTDLLVMTATPIPRTLTLAMYGDMDVSRLEGKPPGRQPIKTVLINEERIEEVIAHLQAALKHGARAYWVCPLVEESEAVDLANAEERAASLAARLPGKVGIVHGRMKAAQKAEVMAEFQAGRIQVLVATTVIEVGVDVAEATIIVIEQAERFGLAQLHQLRGRVGRGTSPSTCLLMYRRPLGETAEARLKIMRETEDGFRIAEEDLRLRGAGDVLGARQSGMPDFRIAHLEVHAELLAAARDDAHLVLTRDPHLEGERGQALRILLYLFGRDEAVRLLKAG